MSLTPNTNLQAAPDFSTIGFTTGSGSTFIERIVRFSEAKDSDVYNVDFRNANSAIKDSPSWIMSDEIQNEVLTLILIVEIYTERYPHRILRFCPDTEMKSAAFGHLQGRFRHLLSNWCTFQGARPNSERSDQSADGSSFTVRRKGIAYISVHTLENNWRGQSRVFDIPFKIELETSVHVGLIVPPELQN